MFVSKIKEHRIRRGMSQAELAEKCNLTQMAISLLERDSTGVTINTLIKISEALNVCIYSLSIYQCPQYNDCKSENKIGLKCFEYKCDNE